MWRHWLRIERPSEVVEIEFCSININSQSYVRCGNTIQIFNARQKVGHKMLMEDNWFPRIFDCWTWQMILF